MNLRLPKPTRSRKTPSAPKLARRQFTVPGPLDGLYRDMRDRRLLLPALLLLVAIIAVPVALSTQKDDPPEPLAFVAPEGAEAVAPAVMTEQPVGVRDYHERLAELKSKNPFADKFKAPKESSEPGDGPAVAPPVDPSPVPQVPTTPTTPTDTTPPPVDTEPDRIILSPRIDAFAGLKGDGRKLRGVEGGDLVPSKKSAPVLIFLGANSERTEAKFIVSRDVTHTEGDGTCRPNRPNCEFLSMKTGEKQFFTFGPHDRVYTVRVVRIYEEIVEREIKTD